MTKIQVYIDFEAISAPFSHKLKVNNDLPYAYSIGIHKGKKFKTKTTVVNFNKVSKDDVFEFIRFDISDKLKELTGNKNFKINKDSVTFIGWAPILEKKILSQSFKGIEVIDQAKGESISLSTLTNKEYKDVVYFKTLKKEVNEKLDKEFIERRGLGHDGALAALAGYELYRSAMNIKSKWPISIDIRELVKEIVDYSKDDIVRMSFLSLNSNVFDKRKRELLKVNADKQRLSRQMNKLRNTIKSLESFDQEMNVSEALKITQDKLEKLKKEKDNL